MRLVFMFYCKHAAGVNSKPTWDPDKPCDDQWNQYWTEGTFWLLNRMIQENIVDEVMVFIESARGPGKMDIPYKKMYGWVMPEVSYLHKHIRPDDVIFIRGGFRSWHDFIVDNYMNNWKMLYGANTGREKWPWWDIILDDLNNNPPIMDKRGRLWLHYEKPTHPKIFYPENVEKKYDICIGASHVHDKKGQWRTIRALHKYKEIYGKNLKAVFPCGGGKGTQTTPALRLLPELDVYEPGFVPREELRTILSQSKLFTHLGTGGQNDRGPIEALRCGTPVVIATPKRHGRVTQDNPNCCHIIKNKDDYTEIAFVFHQLINDWYPSGLSLLKRAETSKWYELTSGVENASLPQMGKIFELFSLHPNTDKKALKEFTNGY